MFTVADAVVVAAVVVIGALQLFTADPASTFTFYWCKAHSCISDTISDTAGTQKMREAQTSGATNKIDAYFKNILRGNAEQ